MNVNQLNNGIQNQIAYFRKHLKKCQSAAAIHQCHHQFKIDDGCTVKVLLQNNANTNEDKAFVEISSGTEAIENKVKDIFKDTFPVTLLPTLTPVWIPRNVCHCFPGRTLSANC